LGFCLFPIACLRESRSALETGFSIDQPFLQ